MVVDVGEMPEKNARPAEVEKWGVIATALEWIGANHPARRRRLIQTAREEKIVEVVRADLILAEWPAAPLRVMIVATRPYGRGIGHLLDQERAAGFLRVFADHVEAQAPEHVPRARRIGGKVV